MWQRNVMYMENEASVMQKDILANKAMQPLPKLPWDFLLNQ